MTNILYCYVLVVFGLIKLGRAAKRALGVHLPELPPCLSSFAATGALPPEALRLPSCLALPLLVAWQERERETSCRGGWCCKSMSPGNSTD